VLQTKWRDDKKSSTKGNNCVKLSNMSLLNYMLYAPTCLWKITCLSCLV